MLTASRLLTYRLQSLVHRKTSLAPKASSLSLISSARRPAARAFATHNMTADKAEPVSQLLPAEQANPAEVQPANGSAEAAAAADENGEPKEQSKKGGQWALFH